MMEISKTLYSWLASINALTETSIGGIKDDNVILANESSDGMKSGLVFVPILSQLYSLKYPNDKFRPEIEELNKFDGNSNRTNNWKTLLNILADFSIKPKDKEFDFNNPEQIVNLLVQIKSHFHNLKKSHVNKGINKPPAINVRLLKSKKDLALTQSCLEFLLNALSKSFSIQPNQAVGLLAESSKYLEHILIKGLKGKFPPVERLLTEFYENLDHFIELLQIEGNETVEMILNMLKGGLYSKGTEVVSCNVKLLSKFACGLSKLNFTEKLWNWLTGEEDGLSAIIYAIHKHPELSVSISEMMINFGKSHLIELFTQLLKTSMNDDSKYWKLISVLIESFAAIKSDKQIEAILENWLESAMEIAENDIMYDADVKSGVLSALCEIWIHCESLIETKKDAPEHILKFICNASRNQLQALRMFALMNSFSLLELFAIKRKPYAPDLYETLADTFADTHSLEDTRDLILTSFGKFYTGFPNVPVVILSEVMITQLASSEGTTYQANSFDYKFWQQLIEHPKLEAKISLRFMDMFAKIILSDSVFFVPALKCLIAICNKLKNEEVTMNLLGKFVKVILSTLMKELTSYFKKFVKLNSTKHKEGDDFEIRKLIRILIEIQSVKDAKANDNIKETVVNLYVEYKNSRGKSYEGLKQLLKNYGSLDDIIVEINEKRRLQKNDEINKLKFIPKQNRNRETVRKINRGTSKSNREKEYFTKTVDPKSLIMLDRSNALKYMDTTDETPEIRIKIREESLINKQRELRRSKAKRLSTLQTSKQEIKLLPISEESANQSSRQLIPYKKNFDLEKNAQIYIDRMRKWREKLENKKEEKRRIDDIKFLNQKRYLKNEALRRNLGAAIELSGDSSSQLLVKIGLSTDEQKINNEMELINLDEEEICTKESIELVMKNYRMLLKHIFSKYATKWYKPKVDPFESMPLISQREFRKMLYDYNINQNTIDNDELVTLFRLINNKFKKHNVMNLDLEGFMEAFMQIAIHLYNKSGKNTACIALVESIISLINHFKSSAKKHGENYLIYSYPEGSMLIMQDQILLKELNSIIIKSPNYPLPEGFKKVQAKDIKLTHSLIPEFIKSKEVLSIAIEVLDEIIVKSIGNHFLEPHIIFYDQIKVVPDKIKALTNATLSSKYPDSTLSKSLRLEYQSNSRSCNTESLVLIKNRIPISTRLLIETMPKEIQSIGLEVGEVMEDILKSIEDGKEYVKSKINILNQVKRQKLEKIEEAQKIAKDKEEKRRKRHNELKQKLKDAKTNNKEEQKTIPKKIKEVNRENLDELRKRIEEKAKKKKEEKEMQMKENEEKKQLEDDKKKRAAIEFVKKKNEEIENKLKDQELKRKKEREEEELKKKNSKLRQEKIYKQVECKMKVDKELLENLKRQKIDLMNFMKKAEVVELLEKYDVSLRTIFEFYARSEPIEINEDVNLKIMQMSYKPFIKFVGQFQFTPRLVSNQEVVVMFKLKMKERSKDIGSLDFNDFLEILARIAIKSKGKYENKNETIRSPQRPEAKLLNIKELTVNTLEDLFKYMELTPELTKVVLLKRLNKFQDEGVMSRSKSPKKSEAKTPSPS